LKPESKFPNFHKARGERNKIRIRYRENLKALDRDDELYIVSDLDYQPEYLHNFAEKHQVETNHLIKENGSPMSTTAYKITKNKSEIETSLEKSIRAIRLQNYISYLGEIFLMIMVLLTIGLAIYWGLSVSGSGN